MFFRVILVAVSPKSVGTWKNQLSKSFIMLWRKYYSQHEMNQIINMTENDSIGSIILYVEKNQQIINYRDIITRSLFHRRYHVLA